MLQQVEFVASQCGGAQGGQDTQEITACEGNSLYQRSGRKKWTQGVFLQDPPMPRRAAGQLWPLLTAATAAAGVRTTLRPSPSSQGLGWAHKDPCLERGSGAERQRTPLSSVTRGRWPSSYKITLYNYLRGVVVRWVWSLLPTNEQWDKRKCNLHQVWIRY